ncbi:MAG: 16S rRNA (cytidine(1402)-2'-O)-methyltransferase [Fimbriimonadales bacterium]|nr:16S rRNA (cytidine(1402)-2'-O)-methyltransferase [Fimbriimonadales bacterium]
MSAGGLVLVATPLGNLGDLSPRAGEQLRSADLWIVEDTRVSGKLQTLLGARPPMRTLHDHTPEPAVERLVDELRAGARAALLTDAGTPCVSDPGSRLVDRCLEEGIPVDAVPGPSAPTLALALSGFFAQRYAFLGFLPRKPGPLRALFQPFAESPLTLVWFDSPHRFRKTLEALADVAPGRRYAVCREMTKLHQQVFRSRLPQLPTEQEVPSKGEFTLVLEGLRRADPGGTQGEEGP